MNPYIEILNVIELDLSHNSLSLDNIKLLSEALKENKTLTSLVLHLCTFKSRSFKCVKNKEHIKFLI
jgi:hypothetical protein